MHKQKPPLRERFSSTLIRHICRVFFAILCSLLITPVIFFTRVYMRTRVYDTTRKSSRINLFPFRLVQPSHLGKFSLAVILGLGLVISLSATLLHPVDASPSNVLNFQARLEGSDGAIVDDGNYNVEFNLYDSASGGSPLWTEDYLNSASNGVRVVDGYLTVNLGSVTPFPSTIPWDQQLWVTMNVGGTSTGTPTWDGEMNPRLQLTSVPYAFQAENADQLQVSNGSNVATLSFTTPSANNSITLPNASGMVCLDSSTTCGFASSSGSSSYIQNGTMLQSNANLDIQSTSATASTAVVEALGSQTGDLLQFVASDGTTTLSGINSSGEFFNQSGSYTGALVQQTLHQNTTYLLPDPGTGSVSFCLSTGNCAGSGGGITGSGTTDFVARFNSGSTINASLLLYDDNSFIGVNTTSNSGELSVLSSSPTETALHVESATSETTPTLTLQDGATPGVGGDLLDFENNSGGVIASVDSSGDISTTGNLAVTGSSQVDGLATFANGVTIQSATGLTLGVAGSTTGSITLNHSGSSYYTVLQSAIDTVSQTISIPNTGTSSDTVCLLTLANCTGTGGGIAGSGYEYYIPEFNTGGGNSIGDSNLYDNGSFLGVNTLTDNGLVSIQGASTTQSSLYVQSLASSTQPTVVLQEGSSPASSADILDLEDSTGANLSEIDSSGDYQSDGFIDNSVGGIGEYGNLLQYSEQLNNSPWTTSNIIVTANDSGSNPAPDGNTTAEKLVSSTTNATLQQSIATTIPGTYNFSLWIKTNSGTQPVQLRIDSTGGTPSTGTPATFTATTTWQRFNVTQTFSGSLTAVIPTVIISNTSATIAAWGAQLVFANTPGVYVRTVGSPVSSSDGIADNGTAIFQNSSNSTGALQVLNSSGNQILSVDTVNNQVVLGASSSQTGQLVFANSSNNNMVSLLSSPQANSVTLNIPADTNSSDTVCLQTLGNCTGAGVNTIGTLDTTGEDTSNNGATINGVTLYLQSASASYPGLVNIGTQTFSGAKTFTNLLTGSAGLTITGGATSISGGAISLTGSGASSFTTTSGALSIDSAAALNLGATNATGITLGRTGITTLNNGALTVTQLLTGNAGATISGGAISLTGSGASSFTTTSGALSIDSAAALNLGATNATGITLGRTGITTLNNGALTVTQLLTGNAGATITGGATSISGGAISLTGSGASSFTTTSGALSIDSAAALNLGATNATGITLGRTGITTLNNGALTVTQLLTGNAGATITGGATSISGGAISLTGSGASSFTTTSGALSIDSAAALNLGATNATGITLGRTGITTLNNGALTVVGSTTLSGGLTVTSGGNVAFAKGTDYSTTGTSNDVNLGTGELFRLTGASAQTITGFANGSDGRLLTIVNAGTTTATISNNNAGSLAANRISTGTGSDLPLPAGASVELVYDAGASLWRVVGSVASAGGAGVNTIGTLDTTGEDTSNNGATINGVTLYLQSASASYPGLVNIGTQTFSGAKTFTNLLTGSAGLTITGGATSISGGAISLTGSGASSFTTTSGALSIDSAAALNLGATNATGITLGRTGITTLNNGALTVTQLLTGNAGATITGGATSISGGAISLTGSGASSFTTTSGALSIDSAAALNLGATNATGITLGRTGITTLNNGALTVTQLLTGNAGATITGGATSISGGAISLTGSGASSFTTTSGALSIDSAAALNLGATNATGITLGRTGITTLNNGALTVVGSTTLSGGLTVTSGGNVAFAKGTDYSTTGTSNDVNLGTGELFRLTGASAQTITGFANGSDGRLLTIVNAGTTTATISNNNAGSLAANRISTGTGSDLPLPAGASVELVYDAGASLWRVVGSVASAGGAGVNTIGTLDTTGEDTSNNGATINGVTLYLQSASASYPGLVNIGTQTFSGAKTFTNLLTGSAGLTITGGATSISGGAISLTGSGASSFTTTSGALSIDSAAALNLGATNATGITLGRTGITTLNNGALTVTQLLTGNAGATITGGATSISGGAISLTGSGASSFTTTSGALSIDSAAALNLGATNATGITLGRTGITTLNNGALTVTQLLTGNAGATISGGAISLTGSGASSFTTTSGALSIDSAAALNLGATNATGITLGRTGITTLNNGALTVVGSTTLSGGLTVTSGGNVAFAKGTDYSTTGTSNDVNLGTGELFRLTGASAQTITGFANGSDGRLLTIVNAGTTTATISNNNAGSLAANRISTGTGSDLPLPAGASVELVYDAGASLWRVVGSVASAGGAGVNTIGTLDTTGEDTSNNGATINGVTLYLQSASASYPGLVNIGTQTFSGAKTFTNLLTGSAGLTITGGATSISGGAISLTGSGASSFTTTSGALSIDSAAALNLGATNATGITLGRTGITTLNNGALTVTQLLTGNAGATITGGATSISGGAISLTGSGASSFTTTSGALSIDSAAALNLGATNATGITLGRTGITTLNNGALTVTQLLTGNAGATITGGAISLTGSGASSFTTTSGALSIDSAAALNLGATNATGITLGRTGITTLNNGALTVTQLLTGNAGATISGGAISLTGSGASSFTTTSGALSIDSAAALNLGATNATGITLGRTGITTLNNGALTVTQLLTGNAGATITGGATSISGGAISLTGSGASSFTTTSGALSIDSAAALNLGATNATGITLGRTGITTLNNGALTVVGSTTLSGGLTVTSGGNVAFAKGTDYSTTGTSNDVNLGTGELFRLTGASAQTITGFANGSDGRLLTIVNAGTTTATISNNNAGSLAANRISTGTGSDRRPTSWRIS